MFIWRPEFAEDPEFEDVIDVESRIVPEEEVVKKQRKKAGLVLEPSVNNEALAADASVNLP
jgi:hypothetical protein